MKIYIEDLLQEKGSNQSFDISLMLPDIIWQGEPLSFKKPFSVTGQIFNKGDILELSADATGEVILQCGSCLEYYIQKLDFSFETRLIRFSDESYSDENDWKEESMDAFFYKGNDIDLTRIVQEFLLLELPIRRRCKEDCKGLCPSCGINLNKGKCQCFNAEEDDSFHNVDERLKALKNYFTNEDKEV